MLSPEEAEKLKSNPEWVRLEEHLTDCIAQLDSCSSIPDSDDFAVSAKARKEAVNILYTILEPFTYSPQPAIDKRKEALRKLGVV